MKKLIGLIGETGAGKDAFCEYVKENYENVFVFKSSDMLTPILENFVDSIKKEDQQWLATTLKERFGYDILLKALIKKSDSIIEGIVILNGIRTELETNAIKKIGGKIVYVTANPEIRWKRVKSRREKADDDAPYERFLEIEKAATEVTIPGAGKTADFRVENNGSEEEFYQEIKKIIKELK